MGGKDEEMRVAAHEAWIEAKGDLKAARHVFKKHARSSTCKRPGRFLQRWGKEFIFRKGFKDRKRTGRPRKLSSETANRAAEAFMKGSVQNGKVQPYVSINEGLDMNPALKDIVSTHTMSPRTLLRNMQQVQPKLKKRTEDIKPVMNSRLKQLRMRACQQLLQFSDQYFRRIFWIDAKTMHILPTARTVWMEAGAPIPVRSDPRLPRSGRDRRTLHFYAAVNWCVGPVAIRFVTGTSGLQHARTYTVGH